MPKTTTDINSILATGASITISSTLKTETELRSLATTANRSGGILTITGCDRFTTTELRNIGTAGGSNVHFIL